MKTLMHICCAPCANQPIEVLRIKSRHGTHIVDYAEQIGLGSKEYELVNID